MTEAVTTTGPQVAVVGAAGHTGRFVAAEMLRRGLRPIAIGRSAAALGALSSLGHGVTIRAANLDQPASLSHALAGAAAVINCAGPFLDTAEAVASAAVDAGIHYLDVSAEQVSVRSVLDRFDEPARRAGVVVLPGVGFFGGLADLLASAALGDWASADAIDVMIGLDGWHPTRGTRVTGERNTLPRVVVSGGRLAPLAAPVGERTWDFGEGIGRQTVSEIPFSETIQIARHIPVVELHTYLSSSALRDIRDPATPAPVPVDASGRSAQRFRVDVVVTMGGVSRSAMARGQDIYAVSAPLACEIAERLLDGRFASAGAHAPGATLNAGEVLAALRPAHLQLEGVAA